jgi:putative tricarboxylic transport membrane protein
MIFGLTPGPLLISSSPDLFWGVIASMYIGNLMLLVLNLPLIPVWVRVLKMPYAYLSVLIILFCLIGAYSLNNNITDVIVLWVFGLIGFFAKKFEYEPAPFVLSFVLGPMIEIALRRSLILSDGSFWIFFERPISGVFLSITILALIVPLFVRKRLGAGLAAEQ